MKKKLLAVICSAALVSSFASVGSFAATASAPLTVRVQSVSGSTVTAVVGTLEAQALTDMPEPPEGMELPDFELPDGQAPGGQTSSGQTSSGQTSSGQMPSGEIRPGGMRPGSSSGDAAQTPPEMPEGEMPDFGGGFPGRTQFTAGDETVTFKITDDTEFTAQFLPDTQEAAAELIAKDAVLEVTLDKNNNAVEVDVKTAAGLGNRGAFEMPSLNLTMADGSGYKGSINADNTGGKVSVAMDDGAVWTLTADSYVSSFDGELSQVTANGFKLYVNGKAVK